jgi:hypothetical protein
MRVLTGAVAALALVGSSAAHAQAVYVEPAPYYAPAPVVVAPVPPAVYGGVGESYAYAPGPYAGPVIVNPGSGRWCRIESDGYRFCWTP